MVAENQETLPSPRPSIAGTGRDHGIDERLIQMALADSPRPAAAPSGSPSTPNTECQPAYRTRQNIPYSSSLALLHPNTNDTFHFPPADK